LHKVLAAAVATEDRVAEWFRSEDAAVPADLALSFKSRTAAALQPTAIIQMESLRSLLAAVAAMAEALGLSASSRDIQWAATAAVVAMVAMST
jgi:hypothetical protein